MSQLAALHIAVAAPALKSLEYMFIDNPLRDIVKGGFRRAHEGMLKAPAGPGFGFDLDEDALNDMTVAAPK